MSIIFGCSKKLPLLLVALGLAIPMSPAHAADQYPSRPIRIITPANPGGTTDFLARILAQHLTKLWGQQAIVDNRVIADGVMRAGQQISSGENLSEAFRNLGIFPPLVVRMLHVGESTGALDTALNNINYFYSRDVRESVDKMLKFMEPALTLGLGVILALIMWSVLSPVYDILGKLKF